MYNLKEPPGEYETAKSYCELQAKPRTYYNKVVASASLLNRMVGSTAPWHRGVGKIHEHLKKARTAVDLSDILKGTNQGNWGQLRVFQSGKRHDMKVRYEGYVARFQKEMEQSPEFLEVGALVPQAGAPEGEVAGPGRLKFGGPLEHVVRKPRAKESEEAQEEEKGVARPAAKVPGRRRNLEDQVEEVPREEKPGAEKEEEEQVAGRLETVSGRRKNLVDQVEHVGRKGKPRPKELLEEEEKEGRQEEESGIEVPSLSFATLNKLFTASMRLAAMHCWVNGIDPKAVDLCSMKDWMEAKERNQRMNAFYESVLQRAQEKLPLASSARGSVGSSDGTEGGDQAESAEEEEEEEVRPGCSERAVRRSTRIRRPPPVEYNVPQSLPAKKGKGSMRGSGGVAHTPKKGRKRRRTAGAAGPALEGDPRVALYRGEDLGLMFGFDVVDHQQLKRMGVWKQFYESSTFAPAAFANYMLAQASFHITSVLVYTGSDLEGKPHGTFPAGSLRAHLEANEITEIIFRPGPDGKREYIHDNGTGIRIAFEHSPEFVRAFGAEADGSLFEGVDFLAIKEIVFEEAPGEDSNRRTMAVNIGFADHNHEHSVEVREENVLPKPREMNKKAKERLLLHILPLGRRMQNFTDNVHGNDKTKPMADEERTEQFAQAVFGEDCGFRFDSIAVIFQILSQNVYAYSPHLAQQVARHIDGLNDNRPGYNLTVVLQLVMVIDGVVYRVSIIGYTRRACGNWLEKVRSYGRPVFKAVRDHMKKHEEVHGKYDKGAFRREKEALVLVRAEEGGERMRLLPKADVVQEAVERVQFVRSSAFADRFGYLSIFVDGSRQVVVHFRLGLVRRLELCWIVCMSRNPGVFWTVCEIWMSREELCDDGKSLLIEYYDTVKEELKASHPDAAGDTAQDRHGRSIFGSGGWPGVRSPNGSANVQDVLEELERSMGVLRQVARDAELRAKDKEGKSTKSLLGMVQKDVAFLGKNECLDLFPMMVLLGVLKNTDRMFDVVMDDLDDPHTKYLTGLKCDDVHRRQRLLACVAVLQKTIPNAIENCLREMTRPNGDGKEDYFAVGQRLIRVVGYETKDVHFQEMEWDSDTWQEYEIPPMFP